MSFPNFQQSFVAGELSPAVYGRTDLAKFHIGASTYRNFFVGYRGGAYSRPGLAFVGMCKQPASAAPPRDITFQFNNQQGFALEFGDNYMRVKSNGAYVTEASKTISGATNANPLVLTITGHSYSAGDWIFISNVGGMNALNGLTWIVNTVPDSNHVTLKDLFGNVVNSLAWNSYTSGGTAARIYTLATPYAAIDLPYLKFVQSADTMTLDCVNPNTLTGLSPVEYPSYNLVRTGAASYTLTEISYSSPISAPTGVTGSVESSTTPVMYYSYVVTAVDGSGNESVSSKAVSLLNNDISVFAGSNTVTWSPVSGAVYYNIYVSTPSYSQPVPIGVNYGYAGQAFGVSFVDTNITADFTRVPPTHQDPFARGQITNVAPTAGGTGFTQAGITYTVNTSTGAGFAGAPIVLSGAFVGFLIDNNGHDYAPTDTITIAGDGTGATATLTIGAEKGTYPAVPAYLFQRFVQANTLNAPDDYFMSQPGKYLNMDSSIPITDGDAIIGNPWAQQINGVQFIQPMLSAAVIFTGAGTWLLSGGGGVGTPFTPTSQQATPQEYNGISSTVPPITVNSEIMYVQSLGSVVRDLSYNYFTQRCTSVDVTVLASHLFEGFQISQWAYAQNPYYLFWCVRNDGTALSLTFIKEQEVQGWARHDTNGLFMGVCSVTEPPVNAVYWIVKRFINGGWYYISERFDNRLWQNVEDCFCVDSGLSYPQPTPNATLTPSGTTGTITLTASSAVFSSGNLGSVVRIGGGIMDVVSYETSTVLTAVVRDNQPITETVPDDPNNTPIPQTAGNWTITKPTKIVTDLNHLIGLQVAILADGGVVNNQIVTAFSDGTVGITLPQAASSITVGIPFLPQLQTMYLDPPSQGTDQTKRKSINAVAVRVQNTRGISVGANQPDQSTTPGGGNPVWSNMIELKMRNSTIFAGQPIPLETDDFYLPVQGGWNEHGQVAIQQSYPICANISGLVTYFNLGDSSG